VEAAPGRIVPLVFAVVDAPLVEVETGLAPELPNQLTGRAPIAFPKRVQRIPLRVVVLDTVHGGRLLHPVQIALGCEFSAQTHRLALDKGGLGEAGGSLADVDLANFTSSLAHVLEDVRMNRFQVLWIKPASKSYHLFERLT
jgi:hypothetical protein